MSRLAQEATTTQAQTTVVELSPKLRQALQTKLTAYAKLAAAKKDIKAKMDAMTLELEALRDEAEEMSVTLDGFGTVTLVAGTYSKFNPKKFVALGGNLAVYQEAVEIKPKAVFTKVTTPGGREDDE